MTSKTTVLWPGLCFLAFLLPIIHSCERGSPRDCAEADFAPGSNLAGEGFDITKMQRKGSFVIDMTRWRLKDKSCMLCKNPYMEQKKQKLPVSVVDWRPNHKCSMSVSSSIYQSSESLVNSMTSCIENNWNVNLGINAKRGEGSLMMAGTQSKLAEYSMEKTKRDKFNFASHSVFCAFYSYGVSKKPLFHSEFKEALKQLPKQYDTQFKTRFYKLIDEFGTHYITKVILGGKVNSVTSIKQCQTAMQGLGVDEVKRCLDVEASASVMGKVSSKVDVKHCDEVKKRMEQKNSFSSSFNDRLTEISGGQTTEPELLFSADKDPAAYKEWLSSIPLHPDVISYSLNPLHELLPSSNPVRKHLRKAIHDFILEKSLWRNCSEPCAVGFKHNQKEPCRCTCNNNPGVNADCCPTKAGLGRLKVTIISASGLWGDTTTATDAYVKVFKNNGFNMGQTQVINNNNQPRWDTTFDTGDVLLKDYESIKLEVWDEDNKWDDDLLGACEIRLKVGVASDYCALNHGVLFYKTEVVCAPSLGGPMCSTYIGSPMNFDMQEAYVSRHARPVPRELLQAMGVVGGEHHFINTPIGVRKEDAFL